MQWNVREVRLINLSFENQNECSPNFAERFEKAGTDEPATSRVK